MYAALLSAGDLDARSRQGECLSDATSLDPLLGFWTHGLRRSIHSRPSHMHSSNLPLPILCQSAVLFIMCDSVLLLSGNVFDLVRLERLEKLQKKKSKKAEKPAPPLELDINVGTSSGEKRNVECSCSPLIVFVVVGTRDGFRFELHRHRLTRTPAGETEALCT